MLDYLIWFINYWIIIELLNWFIYLLIYINITQPRFQYYKSKDIENTIQRIDKLTKNEIEYVIKGCIAYDKKLHIKIMPEDIDINSLSRKEIYFLIGYSLFGINLSKDGLLNDSSSTGCSFIEHDNLTIPKCILIHNILKKVEKKLEINFKNNNNDRYLYVNWGNNYITFNFRPFIVQIPIRLIILTYHYRMLYCYGFMYYACPTTKLGFLYKKINPNKKNLLFIHGFGFCYIPYIKMLLELDLEYNLIILILPNISSYNNYDDLNYMYFPPLKNLKDTIYNFIATREITKINILSHSFGTYITQLLRKDPRSTIIDKVILVDPVIFWIGCFKMSLWIENPSIRNNSLINYTIDSFISFTIYQCIYLKYVTYRIMFGPDFWIYDATELENTNVMLVFEKGDFIIPAEVLYNKVKKYNIKHYYIDCINAVHGSVLLDPAYSEHLSKILVYLKN